MVLDFDIEGVSVEGVRLPLMNHIFKQFQNHLPDSLSKAAQVRKEDYIAGRVCAFNASSKLGISLLSLPTSIDRTPHWPSHLCGSVSHSKKIAVSCVALSDNFFSLGIDAEEIMNGEIDVSEQIANENELKLITNKLGLTILFSAKEALYKAIYPVVKSFVDFKEVEITDIDFSKKTFNIRVISEPLRQLGLDDFQGHFQQVDETIITLITIKNKDKYVYP